MRILVVSLLLLFSTCKAGKNNLEETLIRERETMIREHLYKRGIHDERILNAFRRVPRHKFVLPNDINRAYDDRPLPIGLGQTISQPYIVAYMTSFLPLSREKKILEIGTGSGYQTAILAELVKEVYTIEIFEPLSRKAQQCLSELGYRNIHFKIGDGFLGWKEFSPFDGIIVTCSPENIPPPLIEQLALNGRMIIPVGDSPWEQFLYLVEKPFSDQIKKTRMLPVLFVPLIREKKNE